MGTCVNKGEALLSPHSEENSTKPAVLGTCPLQTLGVEGVGHHLFLALALGLALAAT